MRCIYTAFLFVVFFKFLRDFKGIKIAKINLRLCMMISDCRFKNLVRKFRYLKLIKGP